MLAERTLYVFTVSAGALFGLILFLLSLGRLYGKLAIFGLYPLAVCAMFFCTAGTFDYGRISIASLLDFEFAFMWGGFLWTLIIIAVRPKPVFRRVRRRKSAGWQRPMEATPAQARYRIAADPPDIEAVQTIGDEPEYAGTAVGPGNGTQSPNVGAVADDAAASDDAPGAMENESPDNPSTGGGVEKQRS